MRIHRSIGLLLLFIVTAAVAFYGQQGAETNAGKQNPDAAPYKADGSVKAPRAINTPDPIYTKEARKAKVQGVVVLWVVVGSDGLAHDIKVKKSLGYGLDE